ncbi:hypothetical protein IV498_10850 [Paenarthrobacter sp. Z7-10]|uniref:hypothetical protein n=1 Tax=Paenarthrobacter sp. Z7-10 TaxID=2787635 RepID=UPI0022A9DBCD|nr:hypothetical protein [Paenarthrobacter sp. Z7-10]MCZ2403668.1 hypothetical protein [Paenarthrobacter sp. Z7-10]
MTLLPEILEDEADGETLDCYNRLKAALPARTVNLIYRHLATIPGALPWATSIVEELAPTDFLDRAAQSLALTPGPQLPPLAPQYWHDHGVGEEDRNRALDILRVYNSSNPRNLAVLMVMQHHLDHPGDTAPASAPAGEAQSPSGRTTPADVVSRSDAPLAPPPPPGGVAPEILELIQQTCRQLNISPQLLPTLHRHLGTMPNLYRALSATTANVVADGQVSARAQDWEANAALLAESNNLTLPPPPADSTDRIREAIGVFAHLIPLHCVLGTLWEDRLSGP